MDNLASVNQPSERHSLSEPSSPDISGVESERRPEVSSQTAGPIQNVVPTAVQIPAVDKGKNPPSINHPGQFAEIPFDNSGQQSLVAGLARRFSDGQDPNIISRVPASSPAERLSALTEQVNADTFTNEYRENLTEK